jgi:hypothetical protein
MLLPPGRTSSHDSSRYVVVGFALSYPRLVRTMKFATADS